MGKQGKRKKEPGKYYRKETSERINAFFSQHLIPQLHHEFPFVAGLVEEAIRWRSDNFRREFLRPTVVRIAYELSGGRGWEKETPKIASTELANIATEILDDWIDGSMKRAGKEAFHILYGEKEAIITAIFLLTLAHKLSGEMYFLDATLRGIDKGIMELTHLGKLLREKEAIEVYSGVTKEFMTFCFVFGGKLAEAKEEDLEKLKILGETFGVYIQLINDLLDFYISSEGEENAAIKGISHNDIRGRKFTLPVVYGVEEGVKLEQLLNESGEKINEILTERGAFDRAYAKIQEYSQKIINFLEESFPPSAAREAMKDLATPKIRRKLEKMKAKENISEGKS